MFYKSKTIEHLTADMKISNLCYYGDSYYFESPNEIENAEIVSESEFNEAVSAIVHVTPSETNDKPYQPSNSEIAHMISDLQADLIIAGVI